MANDDEIKKAKEEIAEGAKAVGKAAESLLRKPITIPLTSDAHFGSAWGETQQEVDGLDAEFNREEEMLNQLKAHFEQGDVEVRIMKQGPDGRLIDVSDKVNPRDLRPEMIQGFTTEDGRSQSMIRTPQDRQAAMRVLERLLPGLNLNPRPKTTTATSIMKMEAALAESDKILEHWKR